MKKNTLSTVELIWEIKKAKKDNGKMLLPFAIWCAESVVDAFEKNRIGDNRVQLAITAAKKVMESEDISDAKKGAYEASAALRSLSGYDNMDAYHAAVSAYYTIKAAMACYSNNDAFGYIADVAYHSSRAAADRETFRKQAHDKLTDLMGKIS